MSPDSELKWRGMTEAEMADRSAYRRKPAGLAVAVIDRQGGEAATTSEARVLRPEVTILLHMVTNDDSETILMRLSVKKQIQILINSYVRN